LQSVITNNNIMPEISHSISKGKAILQQAWTRRVISMRLKLPQFIAIRHIKVVRLSALRTCRLYPH
jgi:hypothetical protein